MNSKQYLQITSVIFIAISLLHGLRLYRGWEAVIADWSMPIWLSWLALVIAAFLAISGIKLAKK